jgi:hypothetical protein
MYNLLLCKYQTLAVLAKLDFRPSGCLRSPEREAAPARRGPHDDQVLRIGVFFCVGASVELRMKIWTFRSFWEELYTLTGPSLSSEPVDQNGILGPTMEAQAHEHKQEASRNSGR